MERIINRLKDLPVTLPYTVPGDGECLEENVDGVMLDATHVFSPRMGNAYSVSLQGEPKAISSLAAEFGKEFGAPLSFTEIGEAVQYFWRSPSTELPDPISYRTLGRERILAIMASHGLENCEREMKEILIAYEMFDGDPKAILIASAPALMRVPERFRVRGTFVLALHAICREFADKRIADHAAKHKGN